MGFERSRVGEPAPLRKVIRLAEERSYPVAAATGHPLDERDAKSIATTWLE